MHQVTVAFIASSYSSFVQQDRSLLSERYSVRDVLWNGKRSIPKLTWIVLRSDLSFSWFASDHAYGAVRLARIFGRKSIVFVGGADAAKRPDLDYGVYLDPRKGRLSRWAVEHADRVLVVDEFLREELARNGGVTRRDIITVPLGFDVERLRPGSLPRTNVLTVGIVDDVNVRRKGLDIFSATARLLPKIPFVLVGGRENAATARLKASAPPNLRILGPISDSDLLHEFQRAGVYAQLSRYEAFGSALGEAMACGCVPVGTRVGGIPTVIGETGSYVPEGDAVATARAIRDAFAHGDGLAARRRVAERFPLEKRRRTLTRVVEDLVGG